MCKKVTRTPLQISIAFQHEDSSKLLLSLGANVTPVQNNKVNNDKNVVKENERMKNGKEEEEFARFRDSKNFNDINTLGMVDGELDPFLVAVSFGFFNLAVVIITYYNFLSFYCFISRSLFISFVI